MPGKKTKTLDQPKETPPSVKVIKLSSGDDIISHLSIIDADGIKIFNLQKPFIILMRPKDEQASEFIIGLAPYAAYAAKQTIQISPQHVVAVFDPDTALRNQYIGRHPVELVDKDTQPQVLKEGTN